MKRLFFAAAALMSFTLSFAENDNTSATDNAEIYDMSVNMEKLGMVLELNDDQKESVAEIHRTFCAEMMFATHYGKDERDSRVENAIKKDLSYMHYVLSRKQFKKYATLLNLTLTNRGLK